MINLNAIRINIDSIGYSTKPDSHQANAITKRIRNSYPVDLSLEQFKDFIAAGHTFISGCVIDPALNSLKASNTSDFAFFGLDIDNKEYSVTPKSMVDEVYSKLGVYPAIYYDTFSSTAQHRKFRLIYVFEKPIDHDSFKTMYARLKILFPNLIDNSTSNPNRLWFATNKPNTVLLNVNYSLLGDEFFEKLEKIVPLDSEGNGRGLARKNDIDYSVCNLQNVEDVYRYVWFKPDKYQELAEYVINNVSIVDYVMMAGAELVDHGDYYSSACPFHGGDNPTAFVIYKHSKSAFCFSKQCVAGDVINLCKVFENKSYFEAIKTLLNRFELGVPEDFIHDQKSFKGGRRNGH